jgi:hypothetical protein
LIHALFSFCYVSDPMFHAKNTETKSVLKALIVSGYGRWGRQWQSRVWTYNWQRITGQSASTFRGSCRTLDSGNSGNQGSKTWGNSNEYLEKPGLLVSSSRETHPRGNEVGLCGRIALDLRPRPTTF